MSSSLSAFLEMTMTDEQISQVAESFVLSEWTRLGIVGWEERGPDFMGEVRREADRLKRSILILTSFGFEIRLKPQTKKASHVLA
jgi:hypothetical protein